MDLPSDDKRSSAHTDRERERCGRYELFAPLASGGMATVHLARGDGPDAPLVAIKRPHRHLASDASFLSMLVDEARLASSIRHPNVVRVHELGFEAGEPFIVLDYVEGASLAEIRKELAHVGRAMDTRFAVRIAIDALAGLDAAHTLTDEQGRLLGLVHRDVSPHNVLVGVDGVARLTDFGIAKAADRVQVTRTHEVKGKLAYLAPERVDARRLCTPQSDVFSLGVVLWECIAGRRLFRGDVAVDTLQEVVGAPIPSLRSLGVEMSEALDRAILQGLARDLDVRYPTASAYLEALRAAAGNQVASTDEVRDLVHTLFADRIDDRHRLVREALGLDDISDVLNATATAGVVPPEASRRRLSEIAPLAPSERYVFGSEAIVHGRLPSVSRFGLHRLGRRGLTAAAFLSVAAMFALARRTPAETRPSAFEAITRRVVVPLPFRAVRVTLDDLEQSQKTPAETVVFDVPAQSGSMHRVIAESDDGARAEARVREQDGFAIPEGEGFVPVAGSGSLSAPLPTASPPSVEEQAIKASVNEGTATGRPSPSRGIGTVRDGFTKLR